MQWLCLKFKMSKFTLKLNQSYQCPQYLQTMSSRLHRCQNSEPCQNFRTLSNISDGVFYEKKLLTIFAKHSILDVWQGSEYSRVLNMPLDYLNCFAVVLRIHSLIYTKLIIVFTPSLEFSPYYEVIYMEVQNFMLAKG